MILSDCEIAKEVHYGDLGIEPFDESNVQPASLDIRLGNEFQRFSYDYPIDPLEESPTTDDITVRDGGLFVLYPDEFALATTKETISMPDDLSANVDGRSSYGRLGIAVHITAGYIDPGFEGQITLEIKNHNRMPIRLHPGERIGQLVFKRLGESCKVPYGEERGSKYQNQSGAQPARLQGESDEA